MPFTSEPIPTFPCPLKCRTGQPVLRGHVHWWTDAGKARNRLTLSHLFSREKRLPAWQTRSASHSLVTISNPDPAFSASQKASWCACPGKCPAGSFPCSLSREVFHIRARNHFEQAARGGAIGIRDSGTRWMAHWRNRNRDQTPDHGEGAIPTFHRPRVTPHKNAVG